MHKSSIFADAPQPAPLYSINDHGTMASLLIIDDDIQLTQMLSEYLDGENFTLTATQDAETGLELLGQNNIDLVILDVMLPTMGGFDCLRHIRKKSPVPVIMLTAQGSDIDRVIGLELGADDYLSKPFNPRELCARIKAVLRRSSSFQKPDRLAVGALRLSPATMEVWVNDEAITLTSTETRVLEILMRGASRMVSREDLMEQALARKLMPHDRSIDTHVSNLRRKLGLGQQPGRPSIRSFRSIGYMLLPS